MGDKRQNQLKDAIKLRGCYEVGLYNADGSQLEEYRKIDNTVVTAGRSYVLSLIITSAATNYFNAIEVGTSTTAPATGDTVLNGTFNTNSTAAGTGRLAIASFVTSGLTNNPPSWQAQVTFATNQANTTLGEAGLFNTTAYNAGTLLSHVTFSTINKTTSNTLAISYTISN